MVMLAITRVNAEVHDSCFPGIGGLWTSSTGDKGRSVEDAAAAWHNRRSRGPWPTMTARADRLIKRAKTPRSAGSVRSSYPASSARVFVDALERLNYSVESLLADAGIRRADLNDSDARIPCAVWGPMFRRAMEQRPMKNPGMRLATVTPIGAFPLIDYLIVTSQSVGEGLSRLARYLRLAEARSVPCVRDDEDPIRVLLEGCDTPFSAEFTVTLNVLHFREETEDRFRLVYASFCHEPDDVSEIERVLGCPVHSRAAWNGWVLSRETYQLPLRRRDCALGSLLQRLADESIARLPPMEGLALEVRRALASRVGRGDTRIQTIARILATSPRSLQRRLAAADVSYQRLLDLSRKDAAERYLAELPLSISAVAYLLGYSEPAAFNRAFRRWHHQTPQAFRRAVGTPSLNAYPGSQTVQCKTSTYLGQL
jgi:AraC-like DNA-binding protein